MFCFDWLVVCLCRLVCVGYYCCLDLSVSCRYVPVVCFGFPVSVVLVLLWFVVLTVVELVVCDLVLFDLVCFAAFHVLLTLL